MKKLLFFATMLSMALFSCTSDDEGNVVGWKPGAEPVISSMLKANLNSGSMIISSTGYLPAANALAAAKTRAAVNDEFEVAGYDLKTGDVKWDLFMFPGYGSPSNAPYNWENEWDNKWDNKYISYVEHKDYVWNAATNQNEMDYSGWTLCNINGDGYDYSESNLNGWCVIPVDNFSGTPKNTSNGKVQILCPLGQNVAGTEAFGIYYVKDGQKVFLDSQDVAWGDWGAVYGENGRSDSQSKGNEPNHHLEQYGKTMGYMFAVEEGLEYGVYIVVNGEKLCSGDSNNENLIAVSGDIAVSEDNNNVRSFISFEIDGKYRNAQDITFALIGTDVPASVATGDDPAGDDPAGDDPAGDDPAGDDPAGDDPAGDDPAGDDPAGDDPAGDDPAGDDPTGDDPTDPTPAIDCGVTIELPVDIRGEWIAQADDFAIHNGDYLYENIAASTIENTEDPNYVADTGHNSIKNYVLVNAGERVTISIEDLCAMYEAYRGKTKICDDEKSVYFGKEVSYMDEEGIFAIETYIWPCKKTTESDGVNDIVKIYPVPATEYGVAADGVAGKYLVGGENTYETYLANNKYLVRAQAYQSYNGGGQGAAMTSYIKVTFHIQDITPKSAE